MIINIFMRPENFVICQTSKLFYRNDHHIGTPCRAQHLGLLEPSISARTSKGLRVWNIQKTKEVIGPNCSTILPVIHAITGCDTTSQMFGIGKGAALKRFRCDQVLV